MNNKLSTVAQSCIFTMHAASANDKRQEVPETHYTLPDKETRLLRARLIMEEALETVAALGFEVGDEDGQWRMQNARFPEHYPTKEIDFGNVIDGCCDLIYVATGCLVACGVPDLPHLEEVCAANDRKFPGGAAITDPETGKYLKPAGWVGPDHTKVGTATSLRQWDNAVKEALKARMMEQIQPASPGVNEP